MFKYFSILMMLPALLGGFAQIETNAGAAQPDLTTVLVIDNAVASDTNKRNMAESLATLFSLQNYGGNTAVLFYDTTASDVIEVTGFELRTTVKTTLAQQQLMPITAGSDIVEAIFVVGEYLDDINAPAGSNVLIVTPGILESNNDVELASFISRFVDNGWLLDIAGPLQSNQNNTLAMIELTGGKVYPQLTPAFINELIQKMSSRTGVTQAGIYDQTNVGVGDAIVLDFNVPPQTDSIQLILYNQQGYDVTNIEILRPDGSLVTENELFLSPNIIVYQSLPNAQPAVGRWEVRAKSTTVGLTSGLISIDNPLRLNLVNSSLPAGVQGTLEVQTTINNIPNNLGDLELSATLLQDGDNGTIYKLVDDGTGGDKLAQDGTYSAIVRSFDSGNPVSIILDMRWPQYNIDFQQMAESLPVFAVPNVVIKRYDALRVIPLGEWNLAELQVQLDGQPYFVPMSDLIAVFNGTNSTFVGRLEPLDQQNGLHSKFAVWGIPAASDDYVLQAVLTADFMNFGNMRFQTESVLKQLSVGNLPPSFSARPDWLAGLPVWLPTIFPLVLLITIGFVVKLLRRQRPFGFLYDENGDVLEDFGNVKRSLWQRVLMPSKLNAREVNKRFGPSISFIFKRNEIRLRYKPGKVNSGLRINGKPCPVSGNVKLTEGVWLGYGGRLMQVRYGKMPDMQRMGYDLAIYSETKA